MKKYCLFFLISFIYLIINNNVFASDYLNEALTKADDYRNQELYDNAIIWYQRAADELIRRTGNSGYIPSYMADTYLLKGDCSKPFELYRKALNNVVNEDIRNISWAAPDIEDKLKNADYYCHQLILEKMRKK